MIKLPWQILGTVTLIAGAFAAGNVHGHKTERTTWQAKVEQARADATETARLTERKQQKAARDALSKQLDAERSISSTLRADIDGLRNRPARIIRVPGDPAPDCTGATGRELSGQDAEFLAGLAADADKHRAALTACYDYVDGLHEFINQN